MDMSLRCKAASSQRAVTFKSRTTPTKTLSCTNPTARIWNLSSHRTKTLTELQIWGEETITRLVTSPPPQLYQRVKAASLNRHQLAQESETVLGRSDTESRLDKWAPPHTASHQHWTRAKESNWSWKTTQRSKTPTWLRKKRLYKTLSNRDAEIWKSKVMAGRASNRLPARRVCLGGSSESSRQLPPGAPISKRYPQRQDMRASIKERQSWKLAVIVLKFKKVVRNYLNCRSNFNRVSKFP